MTGPEARELAHSSETTPMSPFATWPWHRCPAVSTAHSQTRRCDLRRGHTGPHLSDHATDILEWHETLED